MDYYSDNGGEWTNFFHKKKNKGKKRTKKSKSKKVELAFEEEKIQPPTV